MAVRMHKQTTSNTTDQLCQVSNAINVIRNIHVDMQANFRMITTHSIYLWINVGTIL